MPASPASSTCASPTFMALIEDLCTQLARHRLPADRVPERPLRQHLRHRLRVRQRPAPELPAGARAFPVNYWDGMTRRGGGRVLRAVQRPARQQGRDLGGDGDQPGTGRHGRRQRRDAAIPGGDERRPPVHTAFFFSSPGLGLPRDTLRHVGRRARGDGRVRRALPVGRQPRPRSGCSTTSSAPSRRCPTAEFHAHLARAAQGHPVDVIHRSD